MSKKDRANNRDNPFSSLKGFRVSGTPPSTPAPPVSRATTSVQEPPEPEDLFALEMKRLGVKGRASKEPALREPAVDSQTMPVDDLAQFLEALGEMETVLADEEAEEEAGTAAAVSSLTRDAQRGRITPEDVLDLHGYSRAEALAKVAWFVDNALYHGCRYLLIITGRGRQSGEAVLRQAVEAWLRSKENTGVREWCRAPARLGGEGALLLALKKKG